jgi:hypothetical protein
MRVRKISFRKTSCYYPFWKHLQNAIAYYTLLEVFGGFGMSVWISVRVLIAELSSVYLTEYCHTQHHSATELRY